MEIKYLIPYLAHGLQIKVSNDSVVTFTMSGIDCLLNSVAYSKNSWYKSSVRVEHVKPILRPMSDLTKEIEFEGEKFIPKDRLWLVKNFKDVWCFEFDRISTWEILSCSDTLNELLKMHFDIYGLIEKNLAISINEK